MINCSFFIPICTLQHSPFTVVKQGTRIVIWSQRPCVKQKRAWDRLRWQKIMDATVNFLAPETGLVLHQSIIHSENTSVYVCVCVSELILKKKPQKKQNCNTSMRYSRHSWNTSRMRVNVEYDGGVPHRQDASQCNIW